MKLKTIAVVAIAVTLLGGTAAWGVLRPVGDDLDAAVGQISSGGNAFEAVLGFLGSDSVANLAQTVKENAVANYEALMAEHGDEIQAAAIELAKRIGESGVVEAIAQGTFDALCGQYGIKL